MEIMSGHQIRVERVRRKMSQVELANALGVSPVWMSQVELERHHGEPLRMKAMLYFIQNPQNNEEEKAC